MQINVNLEEGIDKINNLLKKLEEIENEKVKMINFISAKDLSEMMNTSIVTAREIFNRKDFPACDFPKEKVAEIGAVIKYFSVRRERGE